MKETKVYEIIRDEKELQYFIDYVLPDLEDNQVFYMAAFARKKYCPDVIQSSDRAQIARMIVKRKEDIIPKLRKLEVPLGTYSMRDGRTIPEHALAVYINPNPRCMEKALKELGQRCWNLMEAKNFNIHGEALSCIQRSKGNRKYVDFDIDSEEEDVNAWAINNLNYFFLVKTRGGYHILVDSKKESSIPKRDWNWYLLIKNTFQVDNAGDLLLPIPGCRQGDFTPRISSSKIILRHANDN